jgi:hypothetical protein
MAGFGSSGSSVGGFGGSTRSPSGGGVSVKSGQRAAIGGQAKPAAAPAPTPAPPLGGGGGGGGGGVPVSPALPGGANVYMPPEITSLSTKAEAPAEVTAYRQKFEGKLGEFEKGASAAQAAAMEETNADIERQVSAARQQAASEGRPFDEEKMRAELARGKYKAQADSARARDEAMLGHMTQGLGVVTAGGQMALDMSRHNLDQQKTLMDYYLGRGAASRDAARVGLEGYNAETGRYNADTNRQSAQNQLWTSLLNSVSMSF